MLPWFAMKKKLNSIFSSSRAFKWGIIHICTRMWLCVENGQFLVIFGQVLPSPKWWYLTPGNSLRDGKRLATNWARVHVCGWYGDRDPDCLGLHTLVKLLNYIYMCNQSIPFRKQSLLYFQFLIVHLTKKNKGQLDFFIVFFIIKRHSEILIEIFLFSFFFSKFFV